MTEYSISPAFLQDTDRLYEIECACFTIPWSKDSLSSFITNTEHTFCLTARANTGETHGQPIQAVLEEGCGHTEIIGYIGVMYVLDEGEISNIAVHPDCRGKGIGSALLRDAQEHCRRIGVKTLHLEVRPGNQFALALYHSCGFIQTGLRRGYYADTGEDALLFSWKDV